MSKSSPQSKSYPYSVTNSRGSPYSGTVNLSWVDGTTSLENPRYKYQIKQGLNASTDFSGVKSQILSDSGFKGRLTWFANRHNNPADLSLATATCDGYDGFRPYFRTSNPSLTSADNAALGKFYSSARSAQSSMKGAVFLGEIAETIHLIRHPAENLVKVYSSILDKYANVTKRYAGRRLTKKAIHQELGSLYLQSAFGILPLINDIKDGAEALARVNGKSFSLRCRGYGKESYSLGNTTGLDTTSYGYIALAYNETVTSEVEVIYYGAIKGVPGGANSVPGAISQFGFNTSEFLPTIYELLPWSFLIDYFSNIGDMVSAVSFPSSDLAWCSKTTRVTTRVKRVGNFDLSSSACPPSWGPHGSGSYNWETTRTTVNRVANVQPSVPGLELKVPDFGTKWFNIGALFAQSEAVSRSLSRLLR